MKRFVWFPVSLCLVSICCLIALSAGPRATSARAAVSSRADVAVTLLSDDFEGPWAWSPSSGASGGWILTDTKSDGGTHSAHASSGIGANHMMSRGPFDLSTATAATLDFDFWYDTPYFISPHSYGPSGSFYSLYSEDGSVFHPIFRWNGSIVGWAHQQLDLSLLLGKPHVWIAFMVSNSSDSSAGITEGAYVDNVTFTATVPDSTPPVTTAGLSSSQPASSAGWFHTSPVTVTLTADDGSGSGVSAGDTWYRLQGAASWTTYATAFAVSTPGSTTYEFYSKDAAGNLETPKTVTVKIDTIAPTTGASGLQSSATSGWINHSQSVTLTPSDSGGSGLAATYYTLDGGGQQTYSGSFSVSGQASHTITYWSSDGAGNSEATHAGYVNIDTRKPTSKATSNATVVKGKKVTLLFKITDLAPTCGKATVTITITHGTKVAKTVKLTSVPVNVARGYAFKVTLKKGSYTWTVKATDIAGNVGKASAAKTLIVK